jgi:phage terminase small subunit
MIMALSRELALTPLTRARLAAEVPADTPETDEGWNVLRELRVVKGDRK